MPTVAQRLTHLEGRVNEHASLFTMFEKRFDAIEKRFDAVDQRFDRLDQRVDRFEERVDRFEERFDRFQERVDGRFDALDKKLSHHFALMMSALMTVVAGFIGTVIAALVR